MQAVQTTKDRSSHVNLYGADFTRSLQALEPVTALPLDKDPLNREERLAHAERVAGLIAHDHGYCETAVTVAACAHALGRNEQAFEILRQAQIRTADLEPYDRVRCCGALAPGCAQIGRPEEGERLWEAIRQGLDRQWYHSHDKYTAAVLGLGYARAGRAEDAARLFDQVQHGLASFNGQSFLMLEQALLSSAASALAGSASARFIERARAVAGLDYNDGGYVRAVAAGLLAGAAVRRGEAPAPEELHVPNENGWYYGIPHYLAASAYAETGQAERALEHFRRGEELETAESMSESCREQACRNVAMALIKAGNAAEGAAVARELPAGREGNDQALLAVGRGYLECGNHFEALHAAGEINCHRAQSGLYRAIAESAIRHNDFDAAAAAFRAIARLSAEWCNLVEAPRGCLNYLGGIDLAGVRGFAGQMDAALAVCAYLYLRGNGARACVYSAIADGLARGAAPEESARPDFRLHSALLRVPFHSSGGD